MDKEDLDIFCERSILGLVLGILVFAPLAMGAVDAWAFLVVQALAICVMLVWLVRLWISPKPQLLWPPVCWPVLAFAIYAVARYLTADIEYVARQEMIQVVIFAFLFFAVVNNLHRQEYSQIISYTLITVASGVSVYAVFQYATHSSQVWNQISPYSGRGTGTYISPNNLVCFLELTLPLCVAYLLAGRVSPVKRILLGYAALVILAGIVVTFSRGGWAATILALMFLLTILITQRQHRRAALLLFVLLFAGGSIIATKFLTRTITFVQREKSAGMDLNRIQLELRGDLWQAAEQMWHDHFWWGVGPAHYNYRYPVYRTERVQAQPDRAHNDYLNLLADWGTAGGLITATGIAIFGAGSWQTRRYVRRVGKAFKSGQSNRLAFFAGATAALLALAAHSFVDFNLHIPANALIGVTLLALLSSNLRFATERFWFRCRLPVKLLATATLFSGILYLSSQEIRTSRETWRLAHAESLPVFSPERAIALEKTFAVEPRNFFTAYAVGECYRMQSFQGGDNYESLAKTAMEWFKRGMNLNQYDAYNYLRYGMCLDWLERHDEAGPYFNRADAEDPNSYFIAANIGWHYVQTGDYAAARPWLQRSLLLQGGENPIAKTYLDVVERRLTEAAAGKK